MLRNCQQSVRRAQAFTSQWNSVNLLSDSHNLPTEQQWINCSQNTPRFKNDYTKAVPFSTPPHGWSAVRLRADRVSDGTTTSLQPSPCCKGIIPVNPFFFFFFPHYIQHAPAGSLTGGAVTSRLNEEGGAKNENCCVATERIVVLVKPRSSNLWSLINAQQTGMTQFPIRPCFDVRLQPAHPNGIAAVVGAEVRDGSGACLDEDGGGVQQATRRPMIGQIHLLCSLKLGHMCPSVCVEYKNNSPWPQLC